METLFPYLLKSSGLIAVFLLAYYFFLRKETFFESNRWYLLSGLAISIVLPLVTFQKIVWIAPETAFNWSPIPGSGAVQVQTVSETDWWWVLGIIYGVGVTLLLIKFLIDAVDLRRVLNGQNLWREGGFKLIDVDVDLPPFSFFNYIVYNSDYYNDTELKNIIAHEKVHGAQFHTVDVILARLFCIAFWWNPLIWLYQKSILQNLEFIADHRAIQSLSDRKSYQFTLLKITTHEGCVAISNHFYQSLIKKRIVMLNKNQSKKMNSWKYGIVIPALALFLFQFQVEVVAQVKMADGSTISKETKSVTEMRWTKDSPDEEFKKDAEVMKNSGIDFKFSKIKRNPKGEITGIKISYKDNLGNQQTKEISGSEPIKPILFKREMDQQGNGSIGFYEGNASSKTGFPVPQITQHRVGVELAETPEPPTPPAIPNLPPPPAPPKFPTPPAPPTVPADENHQSEWEAYSNEMQVFAEAYDNSDGMKQFKKEMTDYAEQMAQFTLRNKDFQMEMENFKIEMEKWQLMQGLLQKRQEQQMRNN